MTKIMQNVAWALIITVLVIVVFKMSGHKEVVDSVSNKVVHKLGLVVDPNQSNQDFAKEALGWDLKDIKKKPVATVKAGKVRLLKVIDELEQLRLKNRITTKEAEINNNESEEEMKGLLDSIHKAKSYLKNPASTYPVRIRSITFASRGQLESATASAIRRYETLKSASPQKNNNKAYGDRLSAVIAKRLDMAYQMLELLDDRLRLAEMEENQMAFSEKDKELTSLEARASVILKDAEDAVIQLPSGYTNERERNEKTIDSFVD